MSQLKLKLMTKIVIEEDLCPGISIEAVGRTLTPRTANYNLLNGQGGGQALMRETQQSGEGVKTAEGCSAVREDLSRGSGGRSLGRAVG